jgi:hypothetical protein
LSLAQADIEARGAVFGQIAGYAALDASQPYKSYADSLLLGFSNGETSQYGAVFGL